MSQVFRQTAGPLEPPEVQASPERVPDFLEHQTLSIGDPSTRPHPG